VAGKAVPEGMGRGALGNFGLFHSPPDRLLHVSVVEVKTPVFPGFRYQGQGLGREKPLPGQFLGRLNL
jgi:hypothetical protein